MEDDRAQTWLPKIIDWVLNPIVKGPDGTEAVVDLTKGITPRQVLVNAVGLSDEDITFSDRRQAARVLRALGYNARLCRVGENTNRMKWQELLKLPREKRFFPNYDVLGVKLPDDDGT